MRAAVAVTYSFRHDRCDVDLQEHSWDSQRADDEKGTGRNRAVTVGFPTALGDIGLITNVSHRNDLLDHVGQSCTLRGQAAFDFVVGIAALLIRIAKMKDRGTLSRWRRLVFRTYAREINCFPRGP